MICHFRLCMIAINTIEFLSNRIGHLSDFRGGHSSRLNLAGPAASRGSSFLLNFPFILNSPQSILLTFIFLFTSSVMDPLSALGVAASVVQFVQFGSSLVSKSTQIYKNGTSLAYAECENATRRLNDLTTDVKGSLRELQSLGNPSPDAKALKAICYNCVTLSEELLNRLEKIKVDKIAKSRRWKSFRQALKSACSKDGVDHLARRISECREELNSHLIVSIRYSSLPASNDTFSEQELIFAL